MFCLCIALLSFGKRNQTMVSTFSFHFIIIINTISADIKIFIFIIENKRRNAVNIEMKKVIYKKNYNYNINYL